MQLTAIIERSPDGWLVGQLEELPEVLSQGRTQEELMANLRDAMEQLFLANKQQAKLARMRRHVVCAVMGSSLRTGFSERQSRGPISSAVGRK